MCAADAGARRHAHPLVAPRPSAVVQGVTTDVQWSPVLVGERRATLAHVRVFASIAFFGVLPALTLIVLFVSAIDEDERGDGLPAVLRRGGGDPSRREPVRGVWRAADGMGRPVSVSAAAALLATPLTVLSLRPPGSSSWRCSSWLRSPSPRPRRARLALLRPLAPVAACDLGDTDRQRDALVRRSPRAIAWRFRDRRRSRRRRASGSRSRRSSSSGRSSSGCSRRGGC